VTPLTPEHSQRRTSPHSKNLIGAVILAAGGSSRFGKPKQLLRFDGKSLIRRLVDSAIEANCQAIVVVLGSEPRLVRQELNDSQVILAENQNWQLGIGSSIRAGVQCLIGPNIEAILLLVCDQPFVDSQLIKGLIALGENTKKPIVASSYAETVGVPALFDRSCFVELLSLGNEHGAKSIIQRDSNRVATFPFPQGAIDIDTEEDWERIIRGRAIDPIARAVR